LGQIATWGTTSLVEIYEEVFHVGEELSLDPKNNIKNVKKAKNYEIYLIWALRAHN